MSEEEGVVGFSGDHHHKEEIQVCEANRNGGDRELEATLKRLQSETMELKRQRMEDAKANEKAVSMFAAQEYNWKVEKTSLQKQIQALFVQFQTIEAKKEETISHLNKILMEKNHILEVKTNKMEVVVNANKGLEKKLRRTTRVMKRLSEEIAGLQKDGEQKDNILLAMLRKLKLDAMEEEEVKMLNARRKEAECLRIACQLLMQEECNFNKQFRKESDKIVMIKLLQETIQSKSNKHMTLGGSYMNQSLKQKLLLVLNLKEMDKKLSSVKGFHLLMSLLNKQVKKYQSLEDDTNNLCKRMVISRGGQTENLEGLLDEALRLQGYVVVTGQKLMEIESWIDCSFFDVEGEVDIEKCKGLDMGRFVDIIPAVLTEIQKDLEIQIVWIVDHLEEKIFRSKCDLTII